MLQPNLNPLHFSHTCNIHCAAFCRRTRKEFNDYFKSAAATTVFKKVEYRIFSRLIKSIYIHFLIGIYTGTKSNLYLYLYDVEYKYQLLY